MSPPSSDVEDTASQRSGNSGTTGGASETSSQRSDSKFLKRERVNAVREEGDLLEQKRSIQDGIFSCMYTLVRQSALSSWKFAVLKIVLEGLMGLIVVFNPSVTAWKINTSNPLWQIVRWTVWRSPIMRLYGYNTYIVVLYVMAAAVYLAIIGLVWLTLAMRKQEQSKYLRVAAVVLHVVYDVMFMMFYVSFFDYFVFAANCHFSSAVKYHVYFDGVMCLEMPHILHMSIAIITAAVFFCATALMVVASSDLNPISLGYLSSPAAVARLKILTAKAAYVIVANDLQSWPKPQALLMLFTVAFICWWNFRRLPFYRRNINIVWCSLWFGIMYATGLLAYLVFSKDQSEQHQHDVTMFVLYGIFPAIAAGFVVCAVHAWWVSRPAAKFKDLPLGTKVAKIHKFESVHEVEVLSRVMRNFTIDNTVVEEAAALGEAIIKAGMQIFPNAPHLLILYANFLLEVRKDGPASRTQLQLASRHSPSLVERYQIFCTGEASKRLKDSQDGGMDLQAYIEFRRNFRAVLRVHKEVLLLRNELWALMLRTSLRVAQVDKALDSLESSTAQAHQVYKRVLERYPTNGKLLRCYGKFLEDVKHDPSAASRAYTEANRNGGGDAIMSLDLSKVQGAANKPEFLTSMSIEDDAVIVINAEGLIMMVSQGAQKVFGYPKAELEGTNISILMPQPFCQRHDGYLQRYTNGGEPHILDSVREVVGLHKERYVFPMALCVTRMSGTGNDSIFLGVARPLPSSTYDVRAWLAPNGVIMCGDQNFASLCGLMEGELVGRSLASMVADPDATVDQLLERCRGASALDLQAGSVSEHLLIKHRYLDPFPVQVTVGLAGTDGQRILVLHCRRTDDEDGNMIVVDSHMKVRFASCGMSTLLGFPMRKLVSMRLDQLLPPPYNTLHAKYLSDPPSVVAPTSCRSGKVVHLLNENGIGVPVRLKISTSSAPDLGMTMHVVQVARVTVGELFSEKRLVMMVDFGGRVLSVSQPESDLFGFRSGDMVGHSLCDSIDIFQEWRERAGESQMQLLMLALLDKEHEMPGTSWRVRAHAPISENAAHLPAVAGAAPPVAGKGVNAKSACLQVEMDDSEDENGAGEEGAAQGATGTRIRVTLWRRDLLTGVLELDEDLVVRRASPMTGLIVGMPTIAMLKKPIQKFLDIPDKISWEKLAASHTRHKQRGGLKGDASRGKVSPSMAFIGPHPDTGTMRIIIQGVQVLAPGGKSKVTMTMHPDTTFAGGHADLMRVLHLDAAHEEEQQRRRQLRQKSRKAPARLQDSFKRSITGGAAGEEELCPDGALQQVTDAEQPGRVPPSPQPQDAADGAQDDDHSGGEGDGHSNDDEDSTRSKERGDESDAPRDVQAEGQAKIYSRTASQSDFVAQWVRTLTKRRSGGQDRPGSSSAGAGVLALPAPLAPGAPPAAESEDNARALATIPEGGKGGPLLGASRSKRRAGRSFARTTSRDAPSSRQSSRDIVSPQSGQGRDGGKGGSVELAGEAGSGPRDKWEKGSDGDDSNADGSQAASGISNMTGSQAASELMIDSRRGRLLKTLQKLLMGPILVKPMDRLRINTYALVLIMLVSHIICYAVVNREIAEEDHEVLLVYRQALAMDRSQLIAVRAMMGAFCERANVTAKVSVCANSLNYTLGKLQENADFMEKHHQFVYLGESKKEANKLMPEVYGVWTERNLEYHTYLDTSPPRVVSELAGAWQLGSRFIAAAREALYWLPQMRDEYRLHRTFQFLVTNGLGPLFTGYATSLDLLVDAAWKSVDKLRTTLIILLIVEAIFIQLTCLVYEWYLVQRLESARLVGVLAMFGLPGPVLRQLASKEIKVLDDGADDDDDDVDSDGEEEQRRLGAEASSGDQRHGGEIMASSGLQQETGMSGGVVKAVQHADSDDSKDAQTGFREEEADAVGRAGLRKAASPITAEALGGSGDGDGACAASSSADAVVSRATAAEGGTRLGDAGAGGGQACVAPGNEFGDTPKATTEATMRVARVRGLQVNGKVLVPSFASVAKFTVPFAMWNVGVIIVYVFSLLEMEGMQGPLASLNMASHIIYRYTRVRAIAFGLVSQDDAMSRSVWRDMLSNELRLFESEYDALMYGGIPITQANAVFNHPIPPSTFASSFFAHEFFRAKRCFRYEQGTCFEPGDEYYEVTHNGLDVMVRRMLSEMNLLCEDADEDVAYDGTRYMFMYQVGGHDLYEGLQQAAQLFVDYSIQHYHRVANLHTILLVVTVVLAGLFIVSTLWPHLARLKNDAARQSALLSHVPPEVDIRGHVRGVFKRAQLAGRKKGGKAGRGNPGYLAQSIAAYLPAPNAAAR